ncbi:MAG: sulfopyruvate decarboxylase subunit alpha [Chloroflexota bacterium]|nr:MAG: sulfopyruvate decarboxylase subunit alpha [Chloroflexota bacterium]
MPNCSQEIVARLKQSQISVAASVPELMFRDVLNLLDEDKEISHVRLAREDDGVALCAGAFFGGKRGVVVMQNSGLLLSGNAIVNVALLNRAPFLGLVSFRGNINEKFFYQMPQGQVTIPFLNALSVPNTVIDTPDKLPLINEAASFAFAGHTPYILLITQGVLI